MSVYKNANNNQSISDEFASLSKVRSEHLKGSQSLRAWREQNPNPYRDGPIYVHYDYSKKHN